MSNYSKFDELKTKNLLDLSQTIAVELFKRFDFPWEILNNIGEFVVNLGQNLSKDEYNQIKPQVWVHKKAIISDSTCILGPTIIQKNAEIRHCAFIRGNAIIGKNSVVGNSTEIKNSILFNNVQTPHFNYIGDSILGYRSHLGAGVILSNVKSDKSNVKINFLGDKIQTGFKKFGSVIGDFGEVGCNSVLNPGTILGQNCSIYPLTMVRGFIKENSILKNNGQISAKN